MTTLAGINFTTSTHKIEHHLFTTLITRRATSRILQYNLPLHPLPPASISVRRIALHSLLLHRRQLHETPNLLPELTQIQPNLLRSIASVRNILAAEEVAVAKSQVACFRVGRVCDREDGLACAREVYLTLVWACRGLVGAATASG